MDASDQLLQASALQCARAGLLLLALRHEDVVRGAADEDHDVEHPIALAIGYHVEAVARDGPRRGDARDTGML